MKYCSVIISALNKLHCNFKLLSVIVFEFNTYLQRSTYLPIKIIVEQNDSEIYRRRRLQIIILRNNVQRIFVVKSFN
jgi:hypothetical protein